METEQILPNEHSIPLKLAIEMTKRYRENIENILGDEYRGKNILPLSETFSKDAFNSFFINPACVAIRIYYGMTDDLQTHAIIVGVNSKNEDILPNEGGDSDGQDGVILEDSKRCPPVCGATSGLNNS